MPIKKFKKFQTCKNVRREEGRRWNEMRVWNDSLRWATPVSTHLLAHQMQRCTDFVVEIWKCKNMKVSKNYQKRQSQHTFYTQKYTLHRWKCRSVYTKKYETLNRKVQVSKNPRTHQNYCEEELHRWSRRNMKE